jgi:hypothetical protein
MELTIILNRFTYLVYDNSDLLKFYKTTNLQQISNNLNDEVISVTLNYDLTHHFIDILVDQEVNYEVNELSELDIKYKYPEGLIISCEIDNNKLIKYVTLP